MPALKPGNAAVSSPMQKSTAVFFFVKWDRKTGKKTTKIASPSPPARSNVTSSENKLGRASGGGFKSARLPRTQTPGQKSPEAGGRGKPSPRTCAQKIPTGPPFAQPRREAKKQRKKEKKKTWGHGAAVRGPSSAGGSFFCEKNAASGTVGCYPAPTKKRQSGGPAPPLGLPRAHTSIPLSPSPAGRPKSAGWSKKKSGPPPQAS